MNVKKIYRPASVEKVVVEMTEAEAEALAEMTTSIRHPESRSDYAKTHSGLDRFHLRVYNPGLYEFFQAVTGRVHPNK